MENIHPVYGHFILDEWIPLYIRLNTGQNVLAHNYNIMLTQNFCRIRNTSRFAEITSIKNAFSIAFNGMIKKMNGLSLMLSSAFPNVETNETVDHIDNNPDHNYINNLQWMNSIDNCKKGQEKSVQTTIANGGRNGSYIIMKKKDPHFQNDVSKLISIGTFKSIRLTADFLKETLKKDISNKSLESKISRAIKNKNQTVYGFYFDVFKNDLENEVWKPFVFENKTYMISSFGRVKNSFGHYSILYQNRINKKYTSVSINGSYRYVHRLVWCAFNGEIPKDTEILHDDTAPINENGAYRNYLIDLRLGNRSENMIEFHLNKMNETTKEKQPFEQFTEKKPEISTLDLKSPPETPIQKLMDNPPKYIQYIRANKKRGSTYVIGRLCPDAEKEIRTTSSKLISDQNKFIEIIKIYDNLTGSNYLLQMNETNFNVDGDGPNPT
jgi:hypothetical protein